MEQHSYHPSSKRSSLRALPWCLSLGRWQECLIDCAHIAGCMKVARWPGCDCLLVPHCQGLVYVCPCKCQHACSLPVNMSCLVGSTGSCEIHTHDHCAVLFVVALQNKLPPFNCGVVLHRFSKRFAKRVRRFVHSCGQG